MIDPVFVGYVGATLTTFSFLPQVIKVIKTHDTHSLSLNMYVMFVTGVFFWLVYGIMVKDMPVAIANAITLVLAGFVLYKKITEDDIPTVVEELQHAKDELQEVVEELHHAADELGTKDTK